jgi:hypothetical protein
MSSSAWISGRFVDSFGFMSTAINDLRASTRNRAVLVVGWFLTVAGGLALLYSGYVVPVAHFGTMAVAPTDPVELVSAFNRAWLFSLVFAVLVYTTGIGVIRWRGWARLRHRSSITVNSPPDGDDEGKQSPILAAALGGLLVTVGGASLALFTALLFFVPFVVNLGHAVWSVVLITFVSTALWRTAFRAIGLALVVGALLLAPAVTFLAWAAVDQQQFDVLQNALEDLVPAAGGAGWLGFMAMALARLPLLTSAMLAVGLPLLVVARWRPKMTLSAPALGVTLLLLGSSALIPAAVRFVAALSPAALPRTSSPAETAFPAPPPPPPPP